MYTLKLLKYFNRSKRLKIWQEKILKQDHKLGSQKKTDRII